MGTAVEIENRSREGVLDRFLGSVLGTFVGDALGEGVEGWPHRAIHARFGLLDDFIVGGASHYTDDTQMMIGILETLRDKGRFDPAVCALKFKDNFDPKRGYGRRIFGVMERIGRGLAWTAVGTDSFGNGGAMRIAPIGCFYGHDLEAVKENAIVSARITHSHPEALAGAVAQAAAVGLALQCALSGKTIDPDAYLDQIEGLVRDVDGKFADRLQELRSVSATFGVRAEESFFSMIEVISTRYALNLKAIESVPAAIGAFILTANFRDAVVLAVNLGGDTDTIGAMAGAIAGAYYGYGQIPRRWIDTLENEAKGRDYVIDCVKTIVSSPSFADQALL